MLEVVCDRRTTKPAWRLSGDPAGGGPSCGVLSWFGRAEWRSLSRGVVFV